MPIKEAIILAGGFGTRLQAVVADLPKCLAPIAGKPFLHYLIRYFQNQGIEKFIFSLGYKSELVKEFLKSEFNGKQPAINYELSIEKEPLGTGGAIRLACKKTAQEVVVVINGDTFFKIDLASLDRFQSNSSMDCVLCLKPMANFNRYGVVELNANDTIKNFHEKKFYPSGLINGGVYALNTAKFMSEEFEDKFSFETSYLEKFHAMRKMLGFVQDKYFIDIGIPEDYEKAQQEMSNEL
jgi:D-glycero-alpha-D-manno-heptose 1-phosphate guanylyltransferase